jgi:hypothetical protein
VTWLTREMCARGHTMRAIHTETDLATILREFSSSGVLITTNDLARGFGGQQVGPLVVRCVLCVQVVLCLQAV